MKKFKDFILKEKFWFVFSNLYLIFLCGIILIYKFDFSKIENYLLLLPLYISIVIGSSLKHKNEQDDRNNRQFISLSLLAVNTIVAIMIIISGYVF